MSSSSQSPDSPRVFVLMPFGDDWDPIFRELIAIPFLEAGYEVARADTFLTHRNVLRDIVRGIRSASLIIAELSTPNPNVLYELGIAQGLGIPTVLIAQGLEEVPFDLRSYRIELYSTNFAEIADFRERLKRIALEHLEGRVSFGSPVSDFSEESDVADRLLGGQPPPAEVDTSADDAQRGSADDDPNDAEGFLDHVIRLEDAGAALQSSFGEVTQDIDELGEAAQRKGAEMEEIAARPGGPNPRDVYRLTNSMANDMAAFSQSLDRRLPNMEARAQEFIDAGAGVAQWIAGAVAEDRDQVAEFKDTMKDLADNVEVAVGQVIEMRESTKSVRGISRELDRSSRKAESAIGRLVDLMSQIESFAIKAREIADEALEASSAANPKS